MSTKAQIKASVKYNEANVTQIKFNFNKKTDADVLDRLSLLKNKQGYIKRLIREDMERNPELPVEDLKKPDDLFL